MTEAAKTVAELPPDFYRYLGYVIWTQAGLILVLLGYIYQFGKSVAETRLGIKDAKDCGVRAHIRDDAQDKQILHLTEKRF